MPRCIGRGAGPTESKKPTDGTTGVEEESFFNFDASALDDGEDPGVPMKDRPASTARVNPSTEVSASASSLHVSSSDWFFVSTESFAFRISPTHAT